MARNEEKSQSMLNRYLQMMSSERDISKEKRPTMTSSVNDIPKAEYWRMQVIREISKRVSDIQNETMGESKIRELNDEINKLLREKGHWEKRIKDLGGPNYYSKALRIAKDEGEEVFGGDGYRYFGAARKLKGVQQLLKPKKMPKMSAKTRHELYKGIDVDYFGYRDDDDGVLAPLEAAREAEDRKIEIEEWKNKGITTIDSDDEDD